MPSRKREIHVIQSNIYRILPKVNQASVYMPNIMTLAQAVIQIFCWQGSIDLQCVSRKREIIQSNIHRILLKVNQVIYTLNTICVINIMILGQAILQLLCWQVPLWVKCLSLNRGIIQSNIHRMLRKVNQVIHIMYLNCMIDAIILAQSVLRIFCWQDCFTIRNAKVGQGSFYRILPKVNQVIYTLDTICEPICESAMILAQAILRIFCWQGSIGL